MKEKGSELMSGELERLREQLEAFTIHLEDFASNHRSEIRKNPQFRRHFQEMCASVGVDPLACEPPFVQCHASRTVLANFCAFAASKGFWAEKLGVGDFYYELGVQIIEVCMASSHTNGGSLSAPPHFHGDRTDVCVGIMSLEEIKQRLDRSRHKTRRDTISQ